MPVSPDILSRFVPINSLSHNAQAELAAQAEERRYAPGNIIFREGDKDHLLYFLIEGEVIRRQASGESHRITAADDDALYALARTVPRMYTAEAATDVRIACIEEDLVENNLCYDQATAYEVFEYDGSDDPSWMWDVLNQPTFRKVPAENINTMFQRFEQVSFAAGDVVIQQGGQGDYYYMIREGRARITRTSPTGISQVLAEIGKGDGFGEEALLTGDTRNATVTMLTDGQLMRLSKKDFDELLRAPMVRKVSAHEAEQLLHAGAQSIDVRLEDEFRTGTVRNSVNLPLYLLRVKAGSLDRNKKYLLFCQNGQRSTAAAFLMGQMGFDVYVLEGGLNGLKAAHAAAAHPA